MRTKLLFILSFLFLSLSFMIVQNPPWNAPEKAKALKNPVSGNEKAILQGSKIFKQTCAVCHGISGKGDGVAANGLNPKPTNLTLSKTQNQTDGEIAYKIMVGNNPMPSYKTSLTQEDVWAVTSYIKSL